MFRVLAEGDQQRVCVRANKASSTACAQSIQDAGAQANLAGELCVLENVTTCKAAVLFVVIGGNNGRRNYAR